MHVYIWYGLVYICIVVFLLQKNALLQYGEYAALLPRATEKVSSVMISGDYINFITWYFPCVKP